VASYRPRSSKYMRPGSYLGQVYKPRPTSGADIVMRPCYVGKGHRLALSKNIPIRRSDVEAEQLSFSSAPPFTATLEFLASPDQTISRLYRADGTTIAITKWRFQESVAGEGYDQILMNTADFDKNVTYYLDYQSTSRGVLDPIPFSELRQIQQIGLYSNQSSYTEWVDFVVPGSAAGGTADAGNKYTDPETGGITPTVTGSGTVAFGVSSEPTNQYTRWYKIEATAIYSSITGTGDSVSAPVAGIQTLTDAAGLFTAAEVGKYITISGCATAANNGTFLILTNPGPTQVTYTNATGASETIGFTWTTHKDVTFKTVVINHSGGNGAEPQVPLTPTAADVTFVVTEGVNNTNTLLLDGIYLTYTFGLTNFVIGDKFTWFSYGPGLIEAHSGYDSDNLQFSSIETPQTTGASTAVFAAGSSNDYTDDFVRQYKIRCTVTSPGTQATGSITLVLSGLQNNDWVKVHNGIESVLFEIKMDASYTKGDPDYVTVDMSGAVDSTAAAVLLKDAINLNANWPSGAAGIVATNLLGVISLTSSHYGIRGNQAITKYDAGAAGITVTGMSAATPITATFIWAGYNELPYTYSTFAVTENTASSFVNITLEKGIKLTITLPAFNATGSAFVVGDEWVFKARPPILYYEAKDDRTYTLDITSGVTKTITGTFVASTIEGGFNTFMATCADDGSGGILTLTTPAADPNPIPDNVLWLARNIGNGFTTPSGGAATTRIKTGDKFTSSATCDDVIKWDVDTQTTETIRSSSIRYDVLGTVTTTPNTYYVVLDRTPTTVLYVRNATTGADISYTAVSDSPYIAFASNPGVNLSIRYQYIGKEPDPGQVYYLTALRLRDRAKEYDTPLLWRSSDEARNGLSPASTTNDLLIMSEIAKEAGVNEWYTCQVLDRDEDTLYTDYDYKQAIAATEETPSITDLCVLNKWSVVGAAMSSVERCNDMFNFPSKFRLLWTGAPVNTAIGDVDTEGSLIYTAKRTMAVGGNSPAHGSFIMIGNTWATRTILLDDLSEVTVTLDGSFIAGAAAAMQDGFTDIAETLLIKDLRNIFDTMEEFTDGREVALASNNITYLHKMDDKIFRFYEDISTDNSAIDYEQINAMKQKQYVVRRVTTEMAAKLTGFVPPDPLSAISLIKGFLAELLSNLVAAGKIAPYGAEQVPPTVRDVSSSSDIDCYQDPTIKTDYYYLFWFNLRYPIKRTSGLYGVDSDAVMKGLTS